MNELHNYSAEWKKTALHTESGIPAQPLIPWKRTPYQMRLYPLRGQEHFSDADPTALSSSVEASRDRWMPQVRGSLTSLTLLIPSHKFQTRAISRDIDTAARFTGAATATVGMGLGLELFGILIIGDARNSSSRQQLFYAILGLALSEAIGLLPNDSLFHPLHHVKKPFPHPIVFSQVSSALNVPFLIHSQTAWGKQLAEGLTEERQINTILIKGGGGGGDEQNHFHLRATDYLA